MLAAFGQTKSKPSDAHYAAEIERDYGGRRLPAASPLVRSEAALADQQVRGQGRELRSFHPFFMSDPRHCSAM
jgi:hypothetical protein